eukprot:sb/3467027/
MISMIKSFTDFINRSFVGLSPSFSFVPITQINLFKVVLKSLKRLVTHMIGISIKTSISSGTIFNLFSPLPPGPGAIVKLFDIVVVIGYQLSLMISMIKSFTDFINRSFVGLSPSLSFVPITQINLFKVVLKSLKRLVTHMIGISIKTSISSGTIFNLFSPLPPGPGAIVFRKSEDNFCVISGSYLYPMVDPPLAAGVLMAMPLVLTEAMELELAHPLTPVFREAGDDTRPAGERSPERGGGDLTGLGIRENRGLFDEGAGRVVVGRLWRPVVPLLLVERPVGVGYLLHYNIPTQLNRNRPKQVKTNRSELVI